MAAISQQPTEFNLAVGPNVWVLSGLGAGQNRYVLQIEIGGSAVATFKQTPNPAGVGIFDVSQILQSYMSNAYVETTGKAAPTPGAAIRYRVRYGTQSGTSATVWNGYSNYKVALNGYKDFSDLNWLQAGQYITAMDQTPCEGAGQSPYESCPIAEVKYLTSYPGTKDYSDINGIPNKPVYITDYHTLSFANFHQESWAAADINNKSPWTVIIKYYNAAGTNYETRGYFLTAANGMPVRTNCTSADWLMNDDRLIGTVGAGPVNLQSAGLWPVTEPASYRVELWSKNCNIPADCNDITDVIDTSGCLWAVESFELVTDCSKFEPVQLSFLNEFGVRDYFTFTKRNTYNETTARNNYFRDAGTWSATSYSINPYERGTQTFNSTVKNSMTVSTDWINDDVSLWLEKLFTSPEAKAFVNGEWVAINITTSSYEQKTVARNNKLYRYDLAFDYAQPQIRQRG